MFRRMVTRMGLPAIAGLGLLLVGGLVKADTQGWPLAGSWDTRGGSSGSSLGSYSPGYYATSPSSNGSYSPSSYAVYQTRTPQPGGYSNPWNYSWRSATGGYYGSMNTEGYYGTSPAESPRKRSVLVYLRVPSDAKIWFDGNQTNQAGTTRSFESPPVTPGREYAYQIRIQWKQNGKAVTQRRQINVHAGDVINLAVGSSAEVAMAQ